MARRYVAVAVTSIALCAAGAAAASAATINLEMSQGAAFNRLGHWCGGIKEKVYETGFAANGYPQGNVWMETKCGGSGRGGGGTVTTYTATATVVWTWLGETWQWGPMVGGLEAKPAEDSHGDKLYSVTPCATGYHIGTCSYLETGEPPYQPPAPPGNVHVGVFLQECGEGCEHLAMEITWQQDPERLSLLTKQEMRAEPIGSTAPVLEAERTPYFSGGVLSPVEPNTLYKVTVTESDNEGTSAPSAPVEIKTPNSDGEAERPPGKPACTADSGKVTLSPGLTETPAVQTVTVKGALSECEGNVGETATYTSKFTTTVPVTCALLTGEEQVATGHGPLTIKWLPKEEGTSKGTIAFPVGEGLLAGMSGSVKGGPFATETSFTTTYVSESFTGSSTCGVPQGKLHVIKPVKTGVFSTPIVEFG